MNEKQQYQVPKQFRDALDDCRADEAQAYRIPDLLKQIADAVICLPETIEFKKGTKFTFTAMPRFSNKDVKNGSSKDNAEKATETTVRVCKDESRSSGHLLQGENVIQPDGSTARSAGTDNTKSAETSTASDTETQASAEKGRTEIAGKPYSTKRAKSKQARHHANKHKQKPVRHKKQSKRSSHRGKNIGK